MRIEDRFDTDVDDVWSALTDPPARQLARRGGRRPAPRRGVPRALLRQRMGRHRARGSVRALAAAAVLTKTRTSRTTASRHVAADGDQTTWSGRNGHARRPPRGLRGRGAGSCRRSGRHSSRGVSAAMRPVRFGGTLPDLSRAGRRGRLGATRSQTSPTLDWASVLLPDDASVTLGGGFPSARGTAEQVRLKCIRVPTQRHPDPVFESLTRRGARGNYPSCRQLVNPLAKA